MGDFNLFNYKTFSSSDLIRFHLYLIFKKSYLHLLYQKEFITKFQFGHKDYFYLFLL